MLRNRILTVYEADKRRSVLKLMNERRQHDALACGALLGQIVSSPGFQTTGSMTPF